MTGRMNPSMEGRAGDIWRKWCSGWTQERIALDYEITQERVSQIIQQVRASIPETDRVQLLQRELDFLDQARASFMELADSPLPPAFDQKGGLLRDERGNVVTDASGRVAALKAAMETGDRLAKLLGLHAPAKTEVTLTAQAEEAATKLAADAVARLTGGDEPRGH